MKDIKNKIFPFIWKISDDGHKFQAFILEYLHVL